MEELPLRESSSSELDRGNSWDVVDPEVIPHPESFSDYHTCAGACVLAHKHTLAFLIIIEPEKNIGGNIRIEVLLLVQFLLQTSQICFC